jgi:hypothetical protein
MFRANLSAVTLQGNSLAQCCTLSWQQEFVRNLMGHILLRWRTLVSIPMSVLLPLSLSAQEAAGAILHSSGSGVFVNESAVPASIAVFPNDVIKTEKDVVARLEVTGSEAEINPETIVQFNPSELALDHGSVTVTTSRGVRVRVGCITVTPVHDSQWTHYQVLDVNGKVTVSALKDDVYIDASLKNPQQINERERERTRSLVHEGEQKSREEKCGGAALKTPPGLGAALNSPYAIGVGAVDVGVMACLGLCHDDDPVSPAKP